ncbi:xanthine dehydrogenase family protein molybdopterin-binding subunit [Acidianus sp. RZ1]|uniref:xanthine dehydrogenase family protein molybdopterin-binding subunit n=1 Tax=Acidianus sp. RZ1 TaxID=1540082 RepID=UPI001490E88D|nr:xanthine dehydrogenase family protein molybdopterin-binding subunit [Acidianus sp. RZ1]NON62642.1 xanthine dehydrogenase family protein molybdopterin-binding subunit [Acidianus sp. RZ1]
MIRDDLPKILGKGKYVDDIEVKDVVYLYVVRSSIARGKINDISLPSRSLLTLTWDDVKIYMPVSADPYTLKSGNIVKMPVLADGRVNFVGQPVLAFLSEDRYEGEDIAEEVGIDYEELKPLISIDDSLQNEPIHPNTKSNISTDKVLEGGEISAKEKAEIVVEREMEQTRIISNPIEPKGIIVYWDGEVLHVTGSFQSAFRIRDDLSESLGLNPEKIIVKAYNVGGGFGNKVPSYPEYILASIASMKVKRPVKWIETRREHLTNPTIGRGVKSKVKLYGNRDGEILGIEGTIWNDLGAFNYTRNTTTAAFIASLLTGPYKMRFARVRSLGVFTNLPPTGPYRGAGRPEAALILETLVEDFSEVIGKDSIYVRERNLVPDTGYITPLGLKYDPAGYSLVFSKAKQVFNKMKEKFREKGVSLVMTSEQVRLSPGEGAKVKINNGRVKIYVGTGPHGQAYEETYSRIASQALGIPMDKIEVYTNDTENLKEGIGSFGSRGGTMGGSAVLTACQEIRKKVKDITQSNIEVDVFYRSEDVFSPGAHVAVVDVDDRGIVRVPFYYAIEDVGKVLVKEEVEGQLMGGILQGVSQVLWESSEYDKQGNPLFSSIADAGVADSTQAFNVELEEVEVPSPVATGSRGVGESGTTGALSSVFIAIEKATRKKFRRTPIKMEELTQL